MYITAFMAKYNFYNKAKSNIEHLIFFLVFFYVQNN